MAQRDPLVEYQREGYTLFAAMMDAIKEESVGYLFNIEVQVEEPAAEAPADADAPEERHAPEIKAKGLGAPARPSRLEYSAPSVDGEAREIHAVEDGAVDEPFITVDDSANRAERRRAARANRKRKR
jgi:preprotein translocase subunit SecA